ncbi:N-acetylmuramoyl-L-alanine amidase [Aurantibacter crassamenti]|uniref:peptidoglycan recognition protein family protein n=1 Tax=Aurantibacter crassamenti TaxID=1837375 RepID=UPI00193A2B42|nr:peptidoglycan recognition family protein [Aurantibacter crassamenti]MBM1107104.1 N-acetylmuramoyl-L-alanine amidase [Aurantibacter crassamenti]
MLKTKNIIAKPFQIKATLILLVLLVFSSCSGQKKIIDKPVIFDDERVKLSLEYLKDHYDIHQEVPTIDPKMIVLHWTVIPTIEESFEFFKNATLSNTRDDISSAGSLNVSSQFMVDRDGSIYRLMPENYLARHVIGLNHCAIGVENIGGTEDLPLTEAQLKSNIWLVKYLAKKYAIDYVIGHYEYTLFDGHELWLEKDDGYRTEKTDPGTEFMAEVRSATKNMNFKPLPNKQ